MYPRRPALLAFGPGGTIWSFASRVSWPISFQIPANRLFDARTAAGSTRWPAPRGAEIPLAKMSAPMQMKSENPKARRPLPALVMRIGTLGPSRGQYNARSQTLVNPSPSRHGRLKSLGAEPIGSEASDLLRVRRIRVRLSDDDIDALRQAQRIRIRNDHVDRTHADAAGAAAGARRRAPVIAGLLIEGDRANSRHQNSRVRRWIVTHRGACDRQPQEARAPRI